MPDLRSVPTGRVADSRHFLVADPEHFAVTYAINPWMDPTVQVDARLARQQWENLVATYEALGHRVDHLAAVPGLPDLVFAANGAVVADGIALVSRFRHPERAAEADAHHAWLTHAGFRVHTGRFTCEGQGDVLEVGGVLLAGHGFRTDPAAHGEIAQLTGREVVSLALVDPRYYHLDVALFPLGETVAWYPPAFSPESQRVIEERYPDALEVDRADAEVLGCNAIFDGVNVVLNREAEGLAAAVAERGFTPIPVDLAELRKAGGGPKCCTLELGLTANAPTNREAVTEFATTA